MYIIEKTENTLLQCKRFYTKQTSTVMYNLIN